MATELANIQEGNLSKLPPQSIEAEEAILGAVLANPMVLSRIVEMIKPESFYKPANKFIYDAVLSLFARNEAIDIVTVSEFLRENDKLEIVGGRAYINDLALNVVTTANIEFYAKIVQEKAIKRALINAGSDIVTMAYDNGSTEATLDNAEKLIFNIAAEKHTTDLTPVKDLVLSSYEQIEYRYNHRDELIGVPTGFYDLDGMTAGLQKSDLIILAARPSMGKTAFVLNLAQNVALRGEKAVAVFSLEMPKSQLVKRMLCSEAEVDMQRLNSGHMQPKDWEKLTTSMNSFADAPIYIDDTGSITVMDIRAKCRRLAMEEKNLGLIVIDYLQLMEGGAGSNPNDRNQQISAISRGLKTLARELEVPIIALSQLSRAVESRTDKRPMMSDLRDSGAIEQDADIIMFIYRDEYYNKDEADNKGKAELIIAKHRNGPIGMVPLLFQSNITKFKNPTKTDVF
ncbi:MAG: replicative DNA helicase [Candidatus Gastranaerophilales bacterium]|nr:replicative DNA helicase [Candidatus Gastranaerophilales bacterium]